MTGDVFAVTGLIAWVLLRLWRDALQLCSCCPVPAPLLEATHTGFPVSCGEFFRARELEVTGRHDVAQKIEESSSETDV